MGIFEKLFGRKTLSIEELKEAAQQVEKDRRRNRREIRRWERKRKKTVDRMKQSRQEGNQLEVDYLWDELKEHRKMGSDLRREGRVYNLESIALRRTVNALERLERKSDQGGARQLLQRIQSSGLAERLAIDREDEIRHLEEMNAILDEFAGTPEEEPEDPEKIMFLAELDSICEVEADGDSEGAAAREKELLQEFDLDAEQE